MKKKQLILILNLIFFVTISEAQSRILTGIIKNATNGESLPSANILVKGTSLGTTSNVDGYFTLFNLPSDKFTITVFYVGYHTVEIPVDLSALNKRLVVEMQPVNIDIGEVVVTSQSYKMIKASEGVSDIRVAPRDLASLPGFGEVDIFRSLQLLPGISGTNESSSGLYVRGGTPDQNLVLLDGMTVYNVDHFFGFFSAFNADAIKDIQVYKGAFPAKYGGRISSVVDLTGKTGDPDHFHMNGGVNLLNAHASVEMPLWGKGSVLIAARRSYTDFIESGLYNKIYDMLSHNSSNQTLDQPQIGSLPGGGTLPPGGAVPGGGAGRGGFGIFNQPQINQVRPVFYFYDLNGKITFRPTEKDNLSLTIYSGKDNLSENSETNRSIEAVNNNFPGRSISNSTSENTDWGNQGISFKWSRQWGARFYSNLLATGSTYYSNYKQANEIKTTNSQIDTLMNNLRMGNLERNRVGEVSLKLDNEWQISNNHKLGFGLSASRINVKYVFLRNDTVSVLDRKQEGTVFSGYLQENWKLNPEIEMDAGLRVNNYDLTGKTYIEPRFQFRYKPMEFLTFKGGTGLFNQFVNRIINENITQGSRDFWLLADNDLVNVQRSWHYILGSSLEGKNLFFDVEAYYKKLDGLSEYSLRYRRNTIAMDRLFFQGSGTVKGIDFMLQKKSGKLTGWATYTLSKAENIFEKMNGGNPFPALHDQRHEFKIVGNWEPDKKWKFSSTWIFGSGKPYTAPESQYQIDLLDGRQFSYISVGPKNGERLPAYHRLDVAAHYLFMLKNISCDAGFSVFNLYNRTNIWYREFDLQELPMIVNDVTYLGITPNVSLNFSF